MNDERTWADEADDDWADDFELHAAWSTPARREDIQQWLDEVHQAVTDSGRRAEDLFGPAQTAADERVAALPEERRAAVDLEGDSLVDVPNLALLLVGWFTLVMGVVLLVDQGWSTDLSPAHVATYVALVTSAIGVHSALVAWRSGRPGLAAASAGAGIGVAVALAAVAAQLPDRRETLATFPTVVVLLVGLAVLVLWWRLPTPEHTVDDRSRTWPADRWFTRLEWLLRARYKMPRVAARELTAEARAHTDEAHEHPYATFGAPELHAHALADADPLRSARRGRAERRPQLLFALFALVVVVGSVAVGDVTWQTYLIGAVGLGALWLGTRPVDSTS